MSEWSRDSVVNPIFEPGDGWRMGISIGHWRPQVEKPAPKTLKQKAMALGGSPEFSSVLSFLCEDIRRYSVLFSFWIQIQIMPLPWLPWRAKEAEYAAARARIFGYSANGGPLDQANTSEQVTGKKWKKNTKRKELDHCNRLQELDEAVAGRVKVEAWPQMVDVAFADQLIAVKHWTMPSNMMKCMKCMMKWWISPKFMGHVRGSMIYSWYTDDFGWREKNLLA